MENSVIKFAVIQDGYCVFGAGHTPADAYASASEWMEADEAGPFTPERVEALCAEFQFCGDFRLISLDDSEFDSYLSNQGGYVQSANGDWRAE